MVEVTSLSRRRLLLGRQADAPLVAALRPPWAKPEPAFGTACTRCSKCVDACPEQVLALDPEGFPRFNAQAGECTFCKACLLACESDAFSSAHDRPWTLVAEVADTCLSAQGVVCASCREVCPASAIRILPGARGAPAVDLSACSGCGACVAPCPVDAISLVDMPTMETVA